MEVAAAKTSFRKDTSGTKDPSNWASLVHNRERVCQLCALEAKAPGAERRKFSAVLQELLKTTDQVLRVKKQ